MNYLVILDQGHGLDTPGKRTPLFDDKSFMRENEFNREVVSKAYKLLEKYENVDVVFTTTEKRDIGLSERVVRVNELYEKVKSLYDKIVLISVHANALNGIWGTQNGTSTYHYPNNEVDKEFAKVIHKHLLAKTKLADRGVLEGNFQIVREVKMTACLVECAFMDNRTEAELLRTDEFRQSCAEGIVNGLLEYFGIKKEVDIVTRYKKYSNRIHENRNDVKKFGVDVINESNRKIKKDFCVNGIFQWWLDAAKTKAYPTSILIIDGNIIQNVANHYYDFGTPQSVFIIYKNGKVDMKRVNFATDLDYKNIAYGLGVVGLRNTLDHNFRYSPVSEGFKAGYRKQDGKWVDYTDVLRDTTKIVIGYNARIDKLYLLGVKSATHAELLKIISDNSTGEEYHIAGSVDGGGSGLFRANGEDIISGDGRVICTILYFD